jgi:glycosyltransferase involved in cell wall biosynthesis
VKKLIIQIPCFNEAETLALALAELPREVPGVDVVEWLIIDDGSTDGTADVARANGVDHVVSMGRNSGLARAFMAGIDECLRLGADVIVNTDADNQYCAADIPTIVAPVILGKADMVIGTRPIMDIAHFSGSKKLLQRIGSWAVRKASGTDIADAPSGFRAIDRRAAMRLNVFSEYTYTVETIIQAGSRGMEVVGVPIRVNADLRPSRLVKSVGSYVRRSLLTILRIFMAYRPMATFMVPGFVMLALGLVIGARFLWLFVAGQGAGHVQSLVLTAILLLLGFMLSMFGLVAELQGVNRKLLEDVQWRLRRLEYGSDGSGWEQPDSNDPDEGRGPR